MAESKALTTAADATAQKTADARLDGKLLKRIAAARKAAAAVVEELAEIEDLIARGQSSTAAIRVEWINTWERKTGQSYVGNIARDVGTIRTLRKQMSDNDLRARLRQYLADEDPTLRRERWPLAFFQNRVNSYGGGVGGRKTGRGAQTSDADLFERDLAARRGTRK